MNAPLFFALWLSFRRYLDPNCSQLLGGVACCRLRLLSHSLSLFLPLRVYFSQAGRLLDSCFRIPPLKLCGVSPVCFAPPFSSCSTCPCLSADGGVEIQFSRLLQSWPAGAAAVFPGETDSARSREEENECVESLLCFPAAERQSHSLPKQSGRNTPSLSHSLCSSVTPHLPSRTFSHTLFLSITVLTYHLPSLDPVLFCHSAIYFCRLQHLCLICCLSVCQTPLQHLGGEIQPC